MIKKRDIKAGNRPKKGKKCLKNGDNCLGIPADSKIISTQQRDETAAIVAEIFGFTPRYVRLVMNGDRENREVLMATIEYRQGKNLLVEEIRDLVQFS
jgi:hypothetical protein